MPHTHRLYGVSASWGMSSAKFMAGMLPQLTLIRPVGGRASCKQPSDICHTDCNLAEQPLSAASQVLACWSVLWSICAELICFKFHAVCGDIRMANHAS